MLVLLVKALCLFLYAGSCSWAFFNSHFCQCISRSARCSRSFSQSGQDSCNSKSKWCYRCGLEFGQTTQIKTYGGENASASFVLTWPETGIHYEDTGDLWNFGRLTDRNCMAPFRRTRRYLYRMWWGRVLFLHVGVLFGAPKRDDLPYPVRH